MPIYSLSEDLIDEISKGYQQLSVLCLANNRISRIEHLAKLTVRDLCTSWQTCRAKSSQWSVSFFVVVYAHQLARVLIIITVFAYFRDHLG